MGCTLGGSDCRLRIPRCNDHASPASAEVPQVPGASLMAGTDTILDDAAQRERWGGFDWTDANRKKAAEAIAKYPPGRQHSAVLPLLDLAQRQIGAETGTQGWLPLPVLEFVGREIAMPYIRVVAVAT